MCIRDSMLLTTREPGACRRNFLEVFNASGVDYAEYGYDQGGDKIGGPDFGFRRAFAARVRESMPEKDKNWVYDQVMEIETPEGVKALEKTLAGLFGGSEAVSYTHLRAHETVLDLVCRLLLEKKKQ